MNDRIRELFESEFFPTLDGNPFGLNRKENGDYLHTELQQHWQTFQKGFTLAAKECIDVLQSNFRVRK